MKLKAWSDQSGLLRRNHYCSKLPRKVGNFLSHSGILNSSSPCYCSLLQLEDLGTFSVLSYSFGGPVSSSVDFEQVLGLLNLVRTE